MAKPSASGWTFNHDEINDALDRAQDNIGVFEAERPLQRDSTIASRRRSGSWGDPSNTRAVTLIERDGVLTWQWSGTSSIAARRRRGRRGLGFSPNDKIVTQRRFELLEPDKVSKALQDLDEKFTPDLGLRRLDGGKWIKVKPQTFRGKTLLFVHGTFSNNDMYLREMLAAPKGKEFLGKLRAHYDQVLAFDHPTLAVGPLINALELSRALAGSTHKLDIVAHSRGGLVVRWWLEAFAQGMGSEPSAILVGSPIAGTSLAAGPRLRGTIDLLTNLGAALERTMGLKGTDNPLLIAPAGLLRIFATISSSLANVPIPDAAVALVPGLFAQAGIGNNPEIGRLRLGPPASNPRYFAIHGNFEPGDPGWKFWQHFRKSNLADRLVDIVFDGPNDLVVDTESMTDLGTPGLAFGGSHDYGTSASVHHINYFRQPETLAFIAKAFKVA